MRPIPKPTDIHRLRFGTYRALLRRRNGQVVQLVRNGIRQVSLRQLAGVYCRQKAPNTSAPRDIPGRAPTASRPAIRVPDNQPGQRNDQIAHRRIVVGPEILRNYRRNNHLPSPIKYRSVRDAARLNSYDSCNKSSRRRRTRRLGLDATCPTRAHQRVYGS